MTLDTKEPIKINRSKGRNEFRYRLETTASMWEVYDIDVIARKLGVKHSTVSGYASILRKMGIDLSRKSSKGLSYEKEAMNDSLFIASLRNKWRRSQSETSTN